MAKLAILGEKEVQQAIRKFGIDVDRVISDAVADAALTMRGAVVKSIHEGSGERSKPGEPPNTDTGRLANSISATHKAGAHEAFVHTDIDYAPHLEFGTVKMEARPFLAPQMETVQQKLHDGVKRAINRQIDEAGRK